MPSHECNEVLEPNYTPGSEPEEKEMFEAKQTFMLSVFNANLQTDMGKTIVRRHLVNNDAQSVWKELSEHMRTSSKGDTILPVVSLFSLRSNNSTMLTLQ